MAAAGIGQQVGQQVAVRGEIPQVMVRVDDGQIRLEDLLLRQAQPILADTRHAGRHRAVRLLGHRPAPSLCDRFLAAHAAAKSNASRQRTTRPVDGEGKCAVHMSVELSQKRPNSSRRDRPACAKS